MENVNHFVASTDNYRNNCTKLEHIKSFLDELTVNSLSRQSGDYTHAAKTNYITNIPLT